MSEEKPDQVIIATDYYGQCLADKAFTKSEQKNPRGFVEIFEYDKSGKRLIAKENLVVYLGREWLISRAFNQLNSNISPTEDEFICWFGVGSGGCPIGDPLNPSSVENADTDLDSSVILSATEASYADYRATPDAGYYKKPFDSITFEQDGDNDNTWLIMRIETTITSTDANGFNLNEAGLYTAESDAAGYGGPFHLYAKITFPTIVKSSGRQYLVRWYVYF